MKRGGDWHRVARDRPTQAYNFGWWDERVHHYLVREPAEKYFGLGERSGDMDRAGRRFRMSNLDAMGYGARDLGSALQAHPLLPHMDSPSRARPSACSTTRSPIATFDLGCERDNYHGLYRGFAAEHGDLDYYFIAGPAIADVTRRFTWLTGRAGLSAATGASAIPARP